MPSTFGGKMDSREVRAGNTVYLGPFMAGAPPSSGDGHYAQGDGEIIGTAVEAKMNVKLKADLIKKRSGPNPRIERTDLLMSADVSRRLEDAARMAYKDIIRWVQEKTGMKEMDAYLCVSHNAPVTIAQIVDPHYAVLAWLPKDRLPPAE